MTTLICALPVHSLSDRLEQIASSEWPGIQISPSKLDQDSLETFARVRTELEDHSNGNRRTEFLSDNSTPVAVDLFSSYSLVANGRTYKPLKYILVSSSATKVSRFLCFFQSPSVVSHEAFIMPQSKKVSGFAFLPSTLSCVL